MKLKKRLIILVMNFSDVKKSTIMNLLVNQLFISFLSEAANFLNGYSSANLIQVQCDYFFAYIHEHIDDSSNKFYCTNWKIYRND